MRIVSNQETQNVGFVEKSWILKKDFIIVKPVTNQTITFTHKIIVQSV